MSGDGVVASFRSVLRHRRWRWLLGSSLVSLGGDFLYWVALAVYLSAGGNGPFWIGAALVARLAPCVLLGPIGGAIADRFDRRRTMISLDLARSGIYAAMALIVAAGGPRGVTVTLVALAATATAIYNPAMVAATPVVVPEDDLAAANAARETLSQLAWFVGPALGALLVTVTEPSTVLLIDAATFVVSAAMVSRAGPLGGAREEQTARSGEPGLLADVAGGFRALASDRGLVALTALVTAVLFAFGAEQVLYVYVAADRLDLGAEGVGYLLAAMGVGGIVAAPMSVKAANSPRLGTLLVLASAAACAPVVLLSVVTSPAVAYGLAAVEGAGAIVFEVASLTLLQRAVSERMLGRMYAVQDSLGALGQAIGSIVAPALIVAVGLEVALRVTGVAAIMVIVVWMPGIVAVARRVGERRDQTLVELLASTRELGAVRLADLERLARAATPVTVPADDVIIAEGDRVGDLYVVRTGTLSVRVASAGAPPPPDLGPGDVFGEIGLLRGGVRTATVVAQTDVEMLRIDGSVFVDVVTPTEPAVAPLLGAMHTRLNRTHRHLAVREMAP